MSFLFRAAAIKNLERPSPIDN
jgi:hypothetical protein